MVGRKKKGAVRGEPKARKSEIGIDGARLRAVREARALTQWEFAIKVGMLPGQVSTVEGGKRAVADVTLRKICVAMGVSADYLLGLSTHRDLRS
jgi:transcriptional regulator with XRE-family HTH domain